MLALVAALLWQSFVTQTHVHRGAIARVHVGAAATPQLDRHATPDDDPATCPICNGIAHAGHYLSPGTATLALPILLLALVTTATLRDLAGRALRFGWRSRAPPLAPQA